MFDSHLHTDFSTDSSMKIHEAVNKSRLEGLGIVITEHMDINFPRHGEFVFDVDKYFNDYSKLRSDKLLMGIELGMREDCIDKNKELISNYNFDYVIGSIHVMDGMDIYDEAIYTSDRENVYRKYFRLMNECVKIHDCIDSLGHIDYIARYARYDDSEIYYDKYSDCIDEVLNSVIKMGKAIEINTRRLSDRKAVLNLIKIYKRYNELGGKIVTIGSDSHHHSTIGSGFNAAREIVETCNLKAVYFKNRKPEYDSIY